MRPGEIYLARFPFGDAPGMKIRPVLLLTEPVGVVPEILVAYISSVIPTRLLPSDLLLDPSSPEFRSTNLKASSALRLHKLATIHCSSLARLSGRRRQTHLGCRGVKAQRLFEIVEGRKGVGGSVSGTLSH